MDNGFFGTKYFAISATVAVAILAGAAGAYYVGGPSLGGTSLFGADACPTPTLAGRALDQGEPAVATENGGRRRTESHSFDASAYAGGALDLCVSVGTLVVEPSAGPRVEIDLTIAGDREEAVRITQVEVAFRETEGRLAVVVWESVRGRSEGFFRGDSAEVRMIVRVPSTGAYGIDATNDVGDVRVRDLLVERIDARTNVGSVILTDVHLTGDATLTSDVGDALLDAASVQTGDIRLRANVGDADATLPRRADVGYDAHASTDVGQATVSIGESETRESSGDGPGDTERARSVGYDSKPTRVVVSAITNVGDARITTH